MAAAHNSELACDEDPILGLHSTLPAWQLQSNIGEVQFEHRPRCANITKSAMHIRDA